MTVKHQALRRIVRFHDGKVVVEHECVLVGRIADTTGASIAGTQVAVGLVGSFVSGGSRFRSSLPGTRGPVRGYQHPLIGERVEAALRIFFQVQH
jgi:hypothetical protein